MSNPLLRSNRFFRSLNSNLLLTFKKHNDWPNIASKNPCLIRVIITQITSNYDPIDFWNSGVNI